MMKVNCNVIGGMNEKCSDGIEHIQSNLLSSALKLQMLKVANDGGLIYEF
jgi:hypothetical protein